jgi:hypothetical protein
MAIAEQLLLPELVENLSIGEFIRTCNTNSETRGRCQSDERLQYLFFGEVAKEFNLLFPSRT